MPWWVRAGLSDAVSGFGTASITVDDVASQLAIDGWFVVDPQPALLGSKCDQCGSYFFPPMNGDTVWCKNPGCPSQSLSTVELSRRGKIWSYTDNRYQPPPPYVSADPFVPYVIAAVELEAEQLVVLGQIEPGTDPELIAVGAEVEVTASILFSDEDGDHLVWRFVPVNRGGAS